MRDKLKLKKRIKKLKTKLKALEQLQKDKKIAKCKNHKWREIPLSFYNTQRDKRSICRKCGDILYHYC